MKTKKIIGYLSVFIMFLGILFNPYSLHINGKETNHNSTIKRQLIFNSKEDVSNTIKFVKNTTNDDSVVKEQKFINEGKLTVKNKIFTGETTSLENDLKEATDIAYHVDDVRNSKELQKYLKNALQDGVKVFIYGGLTFEEYQNLLELSKLTAKIKSNEGENAEVYFVNEEELAKKEGKGNLKENPNSLATEQEDIHEVIGYTLNKGEPNKLFVSDITVQTEGEDKNKLKPKNEYYLREILYDVSSTIEKTDIENNNSKSLSSGLIHLNMALAESSRVKDETDFVASSYFLGELVGRVFTDYHLYRANNSSDNNATYDYFTVKDHTQIVGYNGWGPTYLKVDHDIPYDTDHIDDWDPGDDNSSPYSISIGAPWAISFTFDMKGNPNVNDIGSLNLDYGRWEIEETPFTNFYSGTRFEPATAWLSSGTLAIMDIRNWGGFDIGGEPELPYAPPVATTSQKISVVYNYDYKYY